MPHRPATSTLVLLSALVLAACSGNSTSSGSQGGEGGSSNGGSAGSGGSAAAGSGASGGSGGGNFSGSHTLEVGPLSVAPGVENTQCVIMRLDNAEPIHVSRIHNQISSSSHHMIVYKTTDTVEQREPFDCTPFVDTLTSDNGAPLVVTQKYDDILQLPPGVAFTLEARQMIRIELHYINTTGEPVDVSASASFDTIAAADYQHEADFLFIGNPDISIPPNSAWTLGPTYFQMPAEYADAKFFAITGHEHKYGTNVTIATSTSATDPGTSVYDVPGWSWDEPDTVVHDPPFQVPAGGGFRFTCEWNNTSSQSVGFGESANAEMCFFWAYYYPSKGAKVCVHTDQPGFGVDMCCPGDSLCSLLDQYL